MNELTTAQSAQSLGFWSIFWTGERSEQCRHRSFSL